MEKVYLLRGHARPVPSRVRARNCVRVLDAVRSLVEAHGLEHLSMRREALRAGVLHAYDVCLLAVARPRTRTRLLEHAPGLAPLQNRLAQ